MKQLLTYGEIQFGGHLKNGRQITMGPNNKWQQGFLSSIYYLDDFKSCCQDYTQKYGKIELFDIYRRTISYRVWLKVPLIRLTLGVLRE